MIQLENDEADLYPRRGPMTELEKLEKLLADLNENMASMQMTSEALCRRLKKYDDLLRDILDQSFIPRDYRNQIMERMK